MLICDKMFVLDCFIRMKICVSLDCFIMKIVLDMHDFVVICGKIEIEVYAY